MTTLYHLGSADCLGTKGVLLSEFASRFCSLLDSELFLPCPFVPCVPACSLHLMEALLTQEVALTRAVGLGGICDGEVQRSGQERFSGCLHRLLDAQSGL